MHIPHTLLSQALFYELLHNVTVSLGSYHTVICEVDGVTVTLGNVLEQYAALHDDAGDAGDADAPSFEQLLQRGAHSHKASKWVASRYADGPSASDLPEMCRRLRVPGYKPFVLGPRGGKEQSTEDVAFNLEILERYLVDMLRGAQLA